MELATTIGKKYRKLFNVNIKLRKIVLSFIKSNPQINTPKDGVACYMLAKACKTHGVILKLAKLGYGEDADMLARTLFDSAVIIISCIDDPHDDTAMKYLNFDYSTRSQMYKKLLDGGKFKKYFDDRAENPKQGDESIAEIYEKAQKGIDQYGGDFRQRWHSGKTAGEMATLVNLKHYFDTAYSLHSQLVHSLPRCMNNYLIPDGENILIDIKPKGNGIGLSLVSSFNMLFSITEKFNTHYKLVSDDEFRKLAKELQNAVK